MPEDSLVGIHFCHLIYVVDSVVYLVIANALTFITAICVLGVIQ